jgi:hypothetical protein
MRAKFLTLPVLAAVSYAGVAVASSPPTNALALSEIIGLVESQVSFKYIDEVNWDNDGYWEVEYIDNNGRKVEIKIDPVTGKLRK